MIAYSRQRWLVWLGVLWLAGCVSFHLPSAAPPVYYQLDYQPPGVHCLQAVAHQINQHLLDLQSIGLDQGQIGGEIQLYFKNI